MPKPSFKNRDAAIADLKLSDAEVNLYHHHLNNLYNSPMRNQDGSISTVKATTVTIDDEVHLIPTVYGGEAISMQDSIDRAIKSKKFPKYKSVKEAEDRYQQIHKYMERDLPDAYGP